MVTSCYGHNSDEIYHNISNLIANGNSYHGFTSEADTDSISNCESAIHSLITKHI
jgi:hypothetical protein